MSVRTRRARAAIGLDVALLLTLASLELAHPTWSGADIAAGIDASRGVWLPLHGALLAGYLALTWRLWLSVPPPISLSSRLTLPHAARLVLVAFAVLNTIFLVVDGVAVGQLAISDPAAADALWSARPVTLLANATGAAWSAALLLVAATWSSPATTATGASSTAQPARLVSLGLGITWLTFIASAPPVGLAPIVSRLASVAVAAVLVYTNGSLALPAALLIVSAVLRQHVGPEAAFGVLLLAPGLITKRR